MTNPTPLSPAATAVLDSLYMDELNGPQQLMARAHAAAALRAAADQVVPIEDEPRQSAMPFSEWNRKIEAWEARLISRRKFLAIAAELKGAHDDPS